MVAAVVSYVVVWLGVSAYVAWLGVRQSRLAARMDALESLVEARITEKASVTRAA